METDDRDILFRRAKLYYVIPGFIFSFLLTGTVAQLFMMFYPGAQEINITVLSFALYLVFLTSVYFSVYRFNTEAEDRRAILGHHRAILSGNILYVIIPLFVANIVNLLITTLISRISPLAGRRILQEPFSIAGNGLVEYALIFIQICIIAPIAEEIIFRGFLFNFLGKNLDFIWAAVISSVIFGSLHGNTFIQTSVLGFMMAFVYHITGNLCFSILAHGVNNLTAFILIYLSMTPGAGMPGNESAMVYGLVFITLFLLSIISIVMFMKALGNYGGSYRNITPVYRNDGQTGEKNTEKASHTVN